MEEDGCQVKQRRQAGGSDKAEGEEEERAVWLSNFFLDDFGADFCSNLMFLSEYPSSFNEEVTFKNKTKYRIHDFPPLEYGTACELEPNRVACVAGKGISIALSNPPSENLLQHWEETIPNFCRPDIQKLDSNLRLTGKKFISEFPIEAINAENHLINPDVHYEVLAKKSIPNMNVQHPKYFSSAEELPCMIKANHGLGHMCTHKADTDLEVEKIESILQDDVNCNVVGNGGVIYTKVVTEIQNSFCAQFYLSQKGQIRWIGVSEQLIDEGSWSGGLMDMTKHDLFREVCEPYCKPVAQYLHEKGYFGIVGIDILMNDNGGYVIDVNARVNGSTPALLLIQEMKYLGFHFGMYKVHCMFSGTEKELIDQVKAVNDKGTARVVVLCTTTVNSLSCLETHLGAFTKTKDEAFVVIDRLLRQFEGNRGAQ